MDKSSNDTGGYTTPTSSSNNIDHCLRQVNKLSRKISKPSSSSSSSISADVNLHQQQLPVHKWTHDVFPSFRGEDVRRNFLSHIQKEFRRKGIIPFFDNDIKRGESIGPELIQAIRSSKAAVVLLSRNYASSKWCLDELVEIIECKEKYGQMVFAIFYEVDPSHVKKLTGEFGFVFEKTCAGQTKEDIWRWRQAFAEVATIAGYDSRNWVNEAVMIEDIVAEISQRLINSAPSSDFDGLIGMGAHMEKMKLLLCLESDEVRMIGIWGPPGIGKTTIARFLFDQISDGFQLSGFIKMEPSYGRPTCSDDHHVKLHFEQQLLSQLTNQKDLKIFHLGAVQEFLMGKKALVVLDGVDQFNQLSVMPKAQGLGSGTRIIITTQNQKLLTAFEIEHIYQVNLPPPNEALQIFCMGAFDQTSPKDGFEKLAWEVTKRAGSLPLGLRIMGSYLQGLSKEEWEEELPRLRIRLDGEIGSILKLSYDALGKEDKDLFLYVACFFKKEDLNDGTFEDVLKHKFLNVRRGLHVLVQRSLLSMDGIYHKLSMHDLLVQLGKEIVRETFIDEPGKRQFLVDAKEICEVLSDNTGSKSVIGINFDISSIEDDLYISERAFEEMSNLQLLRLHTSEMLHLPQGLKYIPPKLRLLDWNYYPLKILPSNFNPKFLVKIKLMFSKLEKLWKGIQPLGNLKSMDLSYSTNLKELPDLSTAMNLICLDLRGCSSLVEVPYSTGNLTNLQDLDLSGCSNLVELSSFFGNLRILKLRRCSSVLKLPSSIGNLTNVTSLDFSGYSNLVELPPSIGNLTNLISLDFSGCLNLVELPLSIGNLINLTTLEMIECSNLVKLPSSIGNLTNLQRLNLGECSSLVELPCSIGNLTNLQGLHLSKCSSLVKIPSSIGNLQMLKWFSLRECSKLEVILINININLGSLETLDVSDCSQLRSLPEISTNIENLKLCGTLIKEFPLSIKSWSRLKYLEIPYCKDLEEFPNALDIITGLELNDTEIEEIPPWVNAISRLHRLVLKNCRKLVSLPHAQLPDSLRDIDAENCDSLERLPSSFANPIISLRFINCWKLNEEARDIIVQSSAYYDYSMLPGREVHEFFTYRSKSGASVKANLGGNSKRFQACISLVCKAGKGARRVEEGSYVNWSIVDKQSGLDTNRGKGGRRLRPLVTEHLYTFHVKTDEVKSGELFFEFKLESDKWEIAQCGIHQLEEED